MFQYLICGQLVASEFALPGYQQVEQSRSEADVVIRRGAVPPTMAGASYVGPNWQVADSSFLFHVPGVVRCLVVAGREIIAALEAPGREADAAPFLLGTGLGAALHQRGSLVLHAAAVSLDGCGVALCGPTGAGKSTFAAALCRAGGGFISDDVSAIRFGPDGRPSVLSDGRWHRLWAEAVERLSLADRQGEAVRKGIRKYHVDPCGAGAQPSFPLKTVILLRQVRPPQVPAFLPLKLVEAAPLLRREVYRSSLASHMGRDTQLFGQIAALLGHVRVFRLSQAIDFDRLDETVQMVLAHLRESA